MDSQDLVSLIKKAALEAVAATQPANVIYGKVTSTSPLKIFVHQKMILTKNQLVLTKTVKNLKSGDKVVMIQAAGGQEFVVIDCLG